MAELGSGNGSSYPGTLDTNSTLEVNSPNAGKTKARAEVPNDHAAAIVALQTELGTDPAGALTDVKTYLQTEHNTNGTHNNTKVVLMTGNQSIAGNKTFDGNSTFNGTVACNSTVNLLGTNVITSPTVNGSFAGTAFLDEDDMTSNSANKAASQQSIKAYVDAHGLIQRLNTQVSAVATGTTVIPLDDTQPLVAEGNQYMSLAITPTNSNSVLYIEVSLMLSSSAATNTPIVALFKDADGGALAAVAGPKVAGAGDMTKVVLSHSMTAGTTSAITFKVRAGFNGAGTTTFNGTAGGRLFGGFASSSIVILETKS